MQATNRFSLESQEGPYADWPLESRLCVDGVAVDARVPGYVIEAQYRTTHGTLLVTSFDCPHEESNCFLLLDDRLQVIARRQLLTPYATWLLDTHWPDGPSTLVLHYHLADFFRLEIMPPGRLWWRRPRIRLGRVWTWPDEPRMVEAHKVLEARLREIGDTMDVALST